VCWQVLVPLLCMHACNEVDRVQVACMRGILIFDDSDVMSSAAADIYIYIHTYICCR
jgi:hypothetical protein